MARREEKWSEKHKWKDKTLNILSLKHINILDRDDNGAGQGRFLPVAPLTWSSNNLTHCPTLACLLNWEIAPTPNWGNATPNPTLSAPLFWKEGKISKIQTLIKIDGVIIEIKCLSEEVELELLLLC